MRNKKQFDLTCFAIGGLVAVTVVSGALLRSTAASADDVIDDVAITVPVSCSMSGNINTAHTATMQPDSYSAASGSTYENGIGKTTLTAFCNDQNGFSIYAIGFTGDVDGDNTLVGTATSNYATIATGTATSGNTSNWAMKVNKVENPAGGSPVTYNPENMTITNSFNNYHAVPSDYMKVAEYHAQSGSSATDVGTGALGAKIETTYAAFISSTQTADTYTGQVKYVIVHPYSVNAEALNNAVTVVFDGNDLTFPDGSSTNTVEYANVCTPGEYAYVGNTYQEAMTSNISPGGAATGGAYTDSEEILQTFTLPNADKVKVVVDYGVTAYTVWLNAIEGAWDGDWNNWNEDWDGWYDENDVWHSNWFEPYDNTDGTKTYIVEGDTVTIVAGSEDAPEPGYDYGFYIRVYPVYDTEQPNTTGEELPSDDCSIRPISGSYAETTTWKGKWITPGDVDISDENALRSIIVNNYDEIKGTTLRLIAYNPYTLTYDGNGTSNEFDMGSHHYYSKSDINSGWRSDITNVSNITLLAPNYKRTGYGFIGWSTDSNAANHLNTATLYGPNETITVDQSLLSLADNTHVITLYAIWVPSSGNLQNWSGCNNMSIGDVTALTDTRDNNTYAVAKLGDGNCWMIENMRLGGDNSITLTAANTQSAGVLPGATYSSGWSYVPENIQQISNVNTFSQVPTVENINQNNYAYGNYFSWYAAVNATNLVTSSGDVSTSICPIGWSLPGSKYSYFSNNNINPRVYPNNFVASGFVSDQSLGLFDNYYRVSNKKVYGSAVGFYWTGKVTYSSNQRDYSSFMFNSQGSYGYTSTGYNPISFGTNGHSPEGYSVRCVALPSS